MQELLSAPYVTSHAPEYCANKKTDVRCKRQVRPVEVEFSHYRSQDQTAQQLVLCALSITSHGIKNILTGQTLSLGVVYG